MSWPVGYATVACGPAEPTDAVAARDSASCSVQVHWLPTDSRRAASRAVAAAVSLDQKT